MYKPARVLITFVVGVLVLLGLFAGGLLLGGRVFAALQKIPSDTVTILTLHDYWQAYSGVKMVRLALLAGFGVAGALPAVPVIMLVSFLLMEQKRELFGSARFATMAEISNAGLFGNSSSQWPGVVVAKKAGKFLVFMGQQFLSLRAPTRSGKDVGVVIPNLLSYPHSIVAHDIKLDLWRLTAGFRAKYGQQCYLFAVSHPDRISHRWNSLSYIRREYEYRIGDIQGLANTWYPSGGKDAFWNDNAQVLFLGLVLYMMETPSEPVTMANLLRLTTPDTGEGLDKWIESTIVAREERKSELPRLSVECVDALRSFAVNTDQVRANILSTLTAPIKIFRNPMVAAATSGDDFDLRDVRKKKMTIYFGMTPEDLVTYATLANIFYSQLINENTRLLPEDDPDNLIYQCLILWNEFTSVGRLKIVQKAIAYLAAFNMRLFLIFQNKGQVAGREDGYGPEGANTLMTNCALNIMFQPKENEDAKEYSETLGYQTVKGKSRSRQNNAGKIGHSENENDQKRALMLPQEVKEIGFDKVLISMENCKPILADKIIYWNDPAFEGKVGLPTPDVPRLEIVRASYRVRKMTAEEAQNIEVDDIVNQDEILRALGEAIGFDFSEFEIADPDAEVDLPMAA